MDRARNISFIDGTRVLCCTKVFDNDSSLLAHVKNELDLSKKLLGEMEKRNLLLEEKIRDLERDSSKISDMSYAKVLSNQKKVPPIIIKPSNQLPKGAIISKIKSQVDIQDLNISVDTVKEVKNGSVIIKCNNVENNETMVREIQKISNLNCEVKTLSLRKPRVKVVDVCEDLDPETLSDQILSQNFETAAPDDLKIIYIQKNKKKNNSSIFVELAPKLYHATMRNRTLYVGWQRCRVYEDFNLSRCYKCSGYGHSAKKCTNETRCQYCAGNHDGTACQNKENKQCANCLHSNSRYRTERDHKHYAFEESACETFQFYKKRAMAQTEYN